MQLTHTGTRGRQGVHTTACLFSSPSLPPPQPDRLMRALVVFCYSAQHSVWKNWLVFFAAKRPSQGLPCAILPLQQPAHEIVGYVLPLLFGCKRALAASIPFSHQAGKCLSLLRFPAPREADKWSCAPETWTYNLQHAICVASHLAGVLVPRVPKIYLQIDHVMSKMKWKVIVIVDYIIRKQESECLTNGNTWNTCTKS